MTVTRRSRSLPLGLLVLLLVRCVEPDAPESTQVVVVGAGLAGLVSAYELRKLGVETRVLEARASVGGRVATADYGAGLRAEYGMHEMWAGNPLLEIAHELGVELESEYVHGAHSSVMIDGVIHPDVYGTMSEHLDSFMPAAERRALEAWLARAQRLHGRAQQAGLADPEVRGLQDISFETWATRGDALPPTARAWLRLHIECEMASDWSDFSALFGLLGLEIFFDGGATSYRAVGGNARLVEALARAAGPITTSARVTGIRREIDAEGRIRVRVTYLEGDKVRTLEGRRVVVAVPFYRIHQIRMDPPLSDRHRAAIETLGFGKYTVVHLIVERAGTRLATPAGVEITDELLTDGPLGVVYGVSGEPPEGSDRAVFSLLVHGRHAAAFHTVPRAAKVQELLEELDAVQPGFSKRVVDAHVYTHHPAAIAVWRPGRSPLDELSELLREPSAGLYFAGDYTEGGSSDGAAHSALRVSRRIALELEADASWSEAATTPKLAGRPGRGEGRRSW